MYKRQGDTWLKNTFGGSFLLNNIVVLAIVYAATALPFTIYLLSGYFATLPHDFEEAAYIDGAGYGKTMTKLIFPMAQPSIITIILFNFLSFWNEYIISLTLLSSANEMCIRDRSCFSSPAEEALFISKTWYIPCSEGILSL